MNYINDIDYVYREDNSKFNIRYAKEK